MGVNNLSIGSWIEIGGEPVKILQLGIAGRNKAIGLSGQVYGFLDSSEIKPIPITPLILEKNGFEKKNEYSWYDASIHCCCQLFGVKYWDVRIRSGSRRYRPMHLSAENISYIHQLQFILRCADIEKNITL